MIESLLTTNQINAEKNYWLEKLSGELIKSTFPYDFPSSGPAEYRISILGFQIPKELSAKLLAVSNASDKRLHMLLVAGVNALLYKYTGNEDIITGAPIYKQSADKQFMNKAFAVRNNVKGQTTFKQLLMQVRQTITEASNHANYPLERLLHHLELTVDDPYFSLFDVTVLLEPLHEPGYLEHLRTNLRFRFQKNDSLLEGLIEYNASLYQENTIKRVAEHFQNLLSQVVEKPENELAKIDMLSKWERDKQFLEFNDTEVEYDRNLTIQQAFEAQVNKFPNQIAVIFGEEKLTYRELNTRANKLAIVLRKNGISANNVVALAFERSIETVISIMAILKAGGTFLYIDLDFPSDRIQYLLEDACAKVLLVNHESVSKIGHCKGTIINIEKLDDIEDNVHNPVNDPRDTAYIIYTSGSTGKPKGVEIEHRSVINLANWQRDNFQVSENSRISQFATYSFDGAIGETFMALLNGATLVMFDRKELNPVNIITEINQYKINVVVLTPAMLTQLDPESILYPEELTVVSVGEECPVELGLKWSEKCKFANAYGPTEYTVYSHNWFFDQAQIGHRKQAPIGKAMYNTKTYILDSDLKPVPIGVIGEIYLSGEGIAKGYLNKLNKSVMTFLVNPFRNEGRRYYEEVSFDRENTEFSAEPEMGNPIREEVSKEKLMELIKDYDPDLIEKTKEILDSHQDDEPLYKCLIRYFMEGFNNCYQSYGFDEKLMKFILPFGAFEGLSGVDFGFGNGEELSILKNLGADVTGFDLSPSFVQHGRDNRMNVYQIQCDSQPEQFEKDCRIKLGTQDFAITNLTLDRVSNPTNFIRNLLSILKFRGRFAIQTLLPIIVVDDEDIKNPIIYTPEEQRITFGRTVEQDKLAIITLIRALGGRELKVCKFPYCIMTATGLRKYECWSFFGVYQPGTENYPENDFYARMYKTGDLGRFLPSGDVEFAGRVDNMVKVRGFRIELGEIESKLLSHEDIKEAVVVIDSHHQKDKHICAYFVAKEKLSIARLRDFLSSDLPDYMIPTYLIHIEKMPLTPSGKINRKALPDPRQHVSMDGEYVAPMNEIERKLVSIWSELLGIPEEQIGVNSNFFQIGGHSLKATILANRIYREFHIKVPLAEIFKNPSVHSLSEYLKNARKELYQAIVPIREEGDGESAFYPASSSQKRLLIIHQFEDVGTSYNVTGVFLVEGDLDIKRLGAAFEDLIRRHETLRTSFEFMEGEPMQRVHRKVDLEIEYLHGEAKDIDQLIADFIRPFELEKAPLLRLAVRELGNNRNLLILDLSHIISDGTSVDILIRDLIALYEGKSLPPLKIQYKDFSSWQNKLLNSEMMKEQEQYWLEVLAGELPALNLPLDFPRPSVQSFEGEVITFEFNQNLTQKLIRLSRDTGATLHMVLMSIYYFLLSRYSGQRDIIIGLPVAGRKHTDLEELIGMFVNSLALRINPDKAETFPEILEFIKECSLKAYENQDYQFEELVDKLNLRRDLSRNPIFDTMFVLQNMEVRPIEIPSLKFSLYKYGAKTTKFDLIISAIHKGDTIVFDLEYCSRLFKKETMDRFISHFINIAESVIENSKAPLAEINLLSNSEKRLILEEFNRTGAGYPAEKTIHRLFEEQVERTPENIALILGTKKMSYRELNRESGSVAAMLHKHGVGPGSIVGLMMERSLEMISGMLGILKAGAAYLPLDPEYPAERIEFMLADSGATHLLAAGVRGNPGKVTVIPWEEAERYRSEPVLHTEGGALNPVYVIYTSGSTGNPKGVIIEHRAIVNTLWWRLNHYQFVASDRVLQIPSISFDSSVEDIFTPLLGGAGLVLLDPENRLNLKYLQEEITRHQVTHFLAVPSFYRTILMETGAGLHGLKAVTVAGESCPESLVIEHFQKLPGVKLYNEYGPTENSVCATIYQFDGSHPRSLIGKPITNTRCYILNDHCLPQPVGVYGELYISGAGLARGYLNRTELTNERFLPNPFSQGEKIYRTGDLARWLPDGTMEFLGRADNQVKIRGYRVELNEIEVELAKHPMVQEAVVITQDQTDGSKSLGACLVSDHTINPAEMRAFLTKRLPGYMIPAWFVQLEKMPRLSSGKIDRKALQAMDKSAAATADYAPPANPEEARLVDIYRQVLGDGQISVLDNFFELGGNSLKAIHLLSLIRREFEVEVPMVEVFNQPAIRELAGIIKQLQPTGLKEIPPASRKPYYGLSSEQMRLYTLQQLYPQSTSYNITGVMSLEPDVPDLKQVEAVLNQIIARHEVLRTNFISGDQGLVQIIHEARAIRPSYYEAEIQDLDRILNDFIRPFDLENDSLIRISVARLHQRSILLFDLHHIIADGMTLNILKREFQKLYQGAELPPVRRQYKDYSEWRRSEENASEMKRQETFWLLLFQDGVPLLDLPTDFQRPAVKNYRGSLYSFTIDSELSGRIRGFIQKTKSSLLIFLLTVFNVLLHKYSGQRDIVVGVPVSGRNHPDLFEMAGNFVNMLAMRNQPQESKTFMEFLEEVKLKSLKAYENQNYQFDSLLGKLNLKSNPARNPVFDVALNVLPVEEKDATLDEICGRFNFTDIKYDLFLRAIDAGQMEFSLEYSTDLYKRSTIVNIAEQIREIIEQVLNNPSVEIAGIKLSHHFTYIQDKLNSDDVAFDFSG